MKVLSLFDGISCGRVALDRANIDVESYDAYEIEPNAIKISETNYPDIKHHGDVCVADFSQYEGVDLLIGGSPCQSLSIVQSKTRTNLNGKSKLFYEYDRALKEAKPKYFLFENVASMTEESKNIISEHLGCQPTYIDSADFSAQERPRLYWTNIPIQKWEKQNIVLKDIMQNDVEDKYWYDVPLECIDMSKNICAKIKGWTYDMTRRIYNPNHKSPTLTCCSGGHHEKKVLDNGRARKLTPLEYERLQTLPDNYTKGCSDSKRYTALGNGWTCDVIAHIFKSLKSTN